MTSPLHAAWYADHCWHGQVSVVENVPIAESTFRVRFNCPEIARRIVPGQFLMLRLAGFNDPLLGRPLALFDTVLSADGQPQGIDVGYLVLGRMTSRLASYQPGQTLEVWGPLGNGFSSADTEHLVMVAGGIGQTPFLALAKEYLGKRNYGEADRQAGRARRITLLYGVRRRTMLAGVEDFQRLGIEVQISTDDGSAGHHGLVTDLLPPLLDDSRGCCVVCCGPEKMMEAVARQCLEAAVPCQVSLETPMACGIGICFSCVARVRDEQGGWDYRRTCVEGPVFDASQIAF